jgi:hypothetical protein
MTGSSGVVMKPPGTGKLDQHTVRPRFGQRPGHAAAVYLRADIAMDFQADLATLQMLSTVRSIR